MRIPFRSISLWPASICVSSLPIQAAPAAGVAKPNFIHIVIHEAALKWIRNHTKLAGLSNTPYCMSHLGRYYAHKIAGATHLALFRANQSPAAQAQAVAELEKALAKWKDYSAHARQRYKNPVWLKWVGEVGWEKAITDLESDIAREGRPAPSTDNSSKNDR